MEMIYVAPGSFTMGSPSDEEAYVMSKMGLPWFAEKVRGDFAMPTFGLAVTAFFVAL